MSPNAGGGGGGGELRGLSQWVQLCTWSPNKFWRINSIFKQPQNTLCPLGHQCWYDHTLNISRSLSSLNIVGRAYVSWRERGWGVEQNCSEWDISMRAFLSVTDKHKKSTNKQEDNLQKLELKRGDRCTVQYEQQPDHCHTFLRSKMWPYTHIFSMPLQYRARVHHLCQDHLTRKMREDVMRKG